MHFSSSTVGAPEATRVLAKCEQIMSPSRT
jgi:hypothetical protein